MLHLFAFYGREPALVLQRLSGSGCMGQAEPYDVQEGFMVNRRPLSAIRLHCMDAEHWVKSPFQRIRTHNTNKQKEYDQEK